MTLKTRPFMRSATAILMILLMLLTLLPVNARAYEQVYEDTIEMTGTFSGRFELNSATSDLFILENIVPGDSWHGKLKIVNKTYSPMEVSIISITSNLEDNLLYNALDLKISTGDEVLYEGSYGATTEPITDWMKVKTNAPLVIDIIVSLPPTVGNEAQNREMDSTWVLEARCEGDFGGGGSDPYYHYKVEYVDEEGNKLLPDKRGNCDRGDTIVEYAPEIEGYVPDAEMKTLVHNGGIMDKNVITFVYSKADEPEDPGDIPETPVDPDLPGGPSTDPDEPGEAPEEPTPGAPIQTGEDITQSNSSSAPWIFVLTISVIAAAVTFLRIQDAKKKATVYSKKNNADKEES